MKKKKNLFGMLSVLLFLILIGCSDKKASLVEEIIQKYTLLVNIYNELIDVNAEDYSGEYDEQVSELGKKIEKLGKMDISQMDTDSMDDLLRTMQDYIQQCEEMEEIIEKKKSEKQDNQELSVSVTIRNRTTLPIHELYFYNLAKEETRENLLEKNIGILEGTSTFTLVNVFMAENETVWHLEARDEDGNIIEDEYVDLKDYSGKTVSLTMEFNFGTNEGWINFNIN